MSLLRSTDDDDADDDDDDDGPFHQGFDFNNDDETRSQNNANR